MFQYNLLQRAKKDKRHIVLPEGEDERILTAAAELVQLNIVDITLLGDANLIEKRAMQMDIDLSAINCVTPTAASCFERIRSNLL